MLAQLFSGLIDIVGDVHGELDALRALLDVLGYDVHARHPDGRRLVFVGDLCDRGHDSPGVIRSVAQWVEAGRAQAVLGNHELNLLRGDAKEGNGWFFANNHDHAQGKFHSSTAIGDGEQPAFLAFLASLPLALVREDLRVVHACWSSSAVAHTAAAGVASPGRAFEHFEEMTRQQLRDSGIAVQAQQQEATFAAQLRDPHAVPPYLAAVAQRDALLQTGNPLRVLTSGIERVCPTPFYSSGKWRMVQRVPWWNEYEEAVPVVIGHYWRWADEVDRSAMDKGGPDLFGGIAPAAWLGPHGQVFCVDYSVGRRFLQRERGYDLRRACRLGALRWPERVVMFEDGKCLQTSAAVGG